MIEAQRCEPEMARGAWQRCLKGLDDPAEYFGPDVDMELHPGERYYRLTADSEEIGLGWVRRFTKGGHIRSYGFALYPEVRHRGHAHPATRAVVSAIFRDYPETCTVVAMIYGSNPRERWRPSAEGRYPTTYVGKMSAANGNALHFIEVTRASWNAWPEVQEPEEIGAPHSHGQETP